MSDAAGCEDDGIITCQSHDLRDENQRRDLSGVSTRLCSLGDDDLDPGLDLARRV